MENDSVARVLGRAPRLLPLFALLMGAMGGVLVASCSSVDPGGDFQFPQIVYEENFFYCQVEPKVLLAKQCGSGDPTQDGTGGCHANTTSFRVVPHDPPVDCGGTNVPVGSIPAESRGNYQTAQTEMALNVEAAPLLTHPTAKTDHPRQIFAPDSDEASVIRQWAMHRSR